LTQAAKRFPTADLAIFLPSARDPQVISTTIVPLLAMLGPLVLICGLTAIYKPRRLVKRHV
jgi:hypothetical protein